MNNHATTQNRPMIFAALALLCVAVMAFFAKDPVLTSAAVVLATLAVVGTVVDITPAITLLRGKAFMVGIFFLMLFLLLPVVARAESLPQMANQLISWQGAVAVAAGFAISWIGGRGVDVLSTHPAILPGVLVGTLLAVLFLDGLPAGLIIAAGLLFVIGVAR